MAGDVWRREPGRHRHFDQGADITRVGLNRAELAFDALRNVPQTEIASCAYRRSNLVVGRLWNTPPRQQH